MKDQNRKKKTTVGDVIFRIVFLAALVVFCYCAFRLVTIFLAYKAGNDEYSALNEQYVDDSFEFGSGSGGQSDGNGSGGDSAGGETGEETEGETETELATDAQGNQYVRKLPTMKNPIDFESLDAVNSDIIGWIRIGALDISYPVAQSEDNDYYLHRTFEKKDNFAGCIFVDFHNSSQFTDPNTIVYGHNMKDGSMFGKLKQFYEEGVYESDPYFWIYTPTKIYRYHIFSCSQVGAVSETYQLTFADDQDFLDYISDAFASSVVDSQEIEVKAGDKIVTLSTCTGDDSTRFVVQGVMDQEYIAVD